MDWGFPSVVFQLLIDRWTDNSYPIRGPIPPCGEVEYPVPAGTPDRKRQ